MFTNATVETFLFERYQVQILAGSQVAMADMTGAFAVFVSPLRQIMGQYLEFRQHRHLPHFLE
jgi:hypothetical protein